jgi:hypothetical protein
MLPDGLTARIAYTPNAAGSNAADKTASGVDHSPEDSGYDITLVATDAVLGLSGLTLTAGISKINQETVVNYSGDQDETTFAVTYATGGFTLGYQWSEEDLGTSANEKEYTNDGYGITFQVNDDLSIGYNHYESEQLKGTTYVTAEADSYQIAYSMGGASIRLAESNVDNTAYQTAASYDRSGTVLSVSLAF